ncbi:MAG TPA: hypothetical protein VF597_01800 [Candidatus Saccharimonadales bacterium]
MRAIVTVLGVGTEETTVQFHRATDGELVDGYTLRTSTPRLVMADVTQNLKQRFGSLPRAERHAAMGVFVASPPSKYGVQEAWEDHRIYREALGNLIARVTLVHGEDRPRADLETALRQARMLVPGHLRG